MILVNLHMEIIDIKNTCKLMIILVDRKITGLLEVWKVSKV